MKLPALEFAQTYLARAGRIDEERMRINSPIFIAELERYRSKSLKSS